MRLGKRGITWLVAAFWAAVVVLTPAVAAAAGGKPATPLIGVADTRAMVPGIGKWIGDLYNGNLWVFGAVVVVVMAAEGLVLGLGFDKLIGLLGLDLGKLDHHE